MPSYLIKAVKKLCKCIRVGGYTFLNVLEIAYFGPNERRACVLSADSFLIEIQRPHPYLVARLQLELGGSGWTMSDAQGMRTGSLTADTMLLGFTTVTTMKMLEYHARFLVRNRVARNRERE